MKKFITNSFGVYLTLSGGYSYSQQLALKEKFAKPDSSLYSNFFIKPNELMFNTNHQQFFFQGQDQYFSMSQIRGSVQAHNQFVPMNIHISATRLNGEWDMANTGIRFEFDKAQFDKISKLKKPQKPNIDVPPIEKPEIELDNYGVNLDSLFEYGGLNEKFQNYEMLLPDYYYQLLDSIYSIKLPKEDILNLPQLNVPNAEIPEANLPELSKIDSLNLEKKLHAKFTQLKLEQYKQLKEKNKKREEKEKKLNSFISKVKQFSIGLTSAQFSELIGGSISYTGLNISLANGADNTNRIKVFGGVTNQFNIFNQFLLRNPSMISSGQIIQQQVNLNLLTQNSIIDQNVLNFQNRTSFIGQQFEKKISDNSSVVFTNVLASTTNEIESYNRRVNNLSSVKYVQQNNKHYLSFEIANSSFAEQYSSIVDDTLFNPYHRYVNNAPFAFAFNLFLKTKLTSSTFLNLQIRNQNRNYYSPFLLSHLNTVGESNIVLEKLLFKKRVKIENGFQSLLLVLPGNYNGIRLGRLRHGLELNPNENLHLKLNYIYSIDNQNSPIRSNQANGSVGYKKKLANNKNIYLNSSALYSKLERNTDEQSDSSSIFNYSLSVAYEFLTNKKICFIYEFAQLNNSYLEQGKAIYLMPFLKKSNAGIGLSYNRFDSSSFLGLIGQADILENEKFKLQCNFQYSIAQINNSNWTGMLTAIYKF